eukprot:s2552_g5.t1
MERSLSVPVQGSGHGRGAVVSPWYSDRARAECLLQASRPMDLPTNLEGDSSMDPIEGQPGLADQFLQNASISGKGRGDSSAGMAGVERSTASEGEVLRTEGRLPAGLQSMGPVKSSTGDQKGKPQVDELERALEREVVDHLRQQNSKLLEELAFLRGKLEGQSGIESSPWSAVGGVNSNGSSTNGSLGTTHRDRPGRHGSRTPRSRVRESAVSPEKKKDIHRYTPNGTRICDGPPPIDDVPVPPVPPFPMAVDDGHAGDGQHGSFISDLYDTCESKPKVKNGDPGWKPKCEKNGETGVLSPSEAKQMWLEREVHSLRQALDRVSVPKAIQDSGYWNTGFDPIESPPLGPFAASAVIGLIMHGEPREQDRASVHGEHLGGARAPALHGDQHGHGRALSMHGERRDRDRAPFEHGGVYQRDRAVHGLGDERGAWQLHDTGELPDLPAAATPLQFGDWLHLSTPVMKDISSVAGWWWERTLREAKVFYENWKHSNPLQRIQIVPRLPDELRENRFQRTEQRGIQMLLKAIPEAEQLALITDRVLSSTAIIYKLLVRFQPGGAGEKEMLLSQLTTFPKTKDVSELAAGLRNWRRHYGRAEEVDATLPDGVLLLKALDAPLQQLGTLDPQAAFRLSQSRMQLQLDQQPTHRNLWAFSQCLLAEAETLCLMSPTTTTAGQSPLKLKPMDATSTSTPKKPVMDLEAVNGKGKGAMSDTPKLVKGSGGGGKRSDETKVSGGGSGGGGKVGAAASSNASSSATTSSKPVPKVNELAASTSTTATGDGSESATDGKNVSDAGTGGDSTKADRTNEFLQEATQLLKSLQLKPPKLTVMQIGGGVERAEDNMTLIDSGATHGLRPAADMAEWDAAEETCVQLASGSTTDFRLKRGTRILLGHPSSSTAMGALGDLDYRGQWLSYAGSLNWMSVTAVVGALSSVSEEETGYDQTAADRNSMTLDVAVTSKIKQVFPNLPDAVMTRLIPYLDMIGTENFGAKLPWNRRKRRSLARAKHIVLHLFAGPDHKFWEQQCSSSDTEVLCVDIEASISANLHDRNVFAYLLALCASGRVKSILAGPPCRTVSALRYQNDGGPGVFRTDEWPYGLPDLPAADAELVLGDVTLWYRMLALYIIAEDVRGEDDLPTQLIVEQPEDPARYRDPSDVERNKYFSNFRTKEWREFQELYGVQLYHCDQFPMGHAKRKPTTLATTTWALSQLDGIRGGPPAEAAASDQHRSMPIADRCKVSKTWACWAPGLKMAIAAAVRFHLQEVEGRPSLSPPFATGPETPEHSSVQQLSTSTQIPNDEGQHASLQPLRGRGTSEHFSERSLDRAEPAVPSSVQSLDERANSAMLPPVQSLSERADAAMGYVPHQPQMQRQDKPTMQALGPIALEQWKRHYLNDHLPARRDCAHCVRAQARSKPHKRIEHPESYTLSVDLSGRLSPGDDQQVKGCKYLLVGCYTYPVTKQGKSLIAVPGQPDPEEDHQLPDLDEDIATDDPEPEADEAVLPEEDEPMEEEDVEDSPDVKAAKSMDQTWHKLVQESKNVAVRHLTFVEPIKSRAVKHVLPALSRVHARLRSLGLPIYRIHSDRAKEFCSAPIKNWALERDVLTTMTSGSTYKANGRVEGEMNVVKKAIRTLISAGASTLTQWPLASRHVGERRLRSQLHQLGWPVGRLLRFGATAFALRKSWQERYAPWREATWCREAVFHRRRGGASLPQPDVEEQVLYLPERPANAPAHRHRKKSSTPAISMFFDIEGERLITQRHPDMFEYPFVADASSDSWTLETDQDIPSPSTVRSTVEEEDGGGEWEEVPNTGAGGSYPGTSSNQLMLRRFQCRTSALRDLHSNLTDYIRDEFQHIDATTSTQSLWMPTVTEAMVNRVALEEQLLSIAEVENKDANEFLVTRTVSNAEVWRDLEAWAPSIKQEYMQLVHEKRAVRQMPLHQLQQLSQEKGLPIELLPGKTVHTRKAQTGSYRSRAVICGNYASSTAAEQDVYAGGADTMQVRAALKTAARRDDTKLVAMSIPKIFKHLGLANEDDVWVVEMALYGLTTSPKDWGIHRDCTLAKLASKRFLEDEGEIHGHFEKSGDENLWRLVEVGPQGTRWCGLLCVCVDGLLFCGEVPALQSALQAVESQWSCAAAEWATTEKALKFCGIEITVDKNQDGLHLSQSGYEKEVLDRWRVGRGAEYPHFKLSETDFEQVENIDPKVLKEAQALAGSLLWLATKTRPDLAYGVSTMSRLISRNPQKALEVGEILLGYIKANPGDLHYFKHFPNDGWGERSQLKAQRNQHSLEVFSDIAYAAGAGHRSVQGILVYFAGSPIAWQSSQQPFVTHSTAEAELVSYCESLLVGRATESLLCALWGVPLDKKNPFEKTIYGDNLAAIGLASGNTCSSWRTRHLRIRAAILKEALEEECEIPGGVWRLLHLKGTELVADGLTKPLLGQAFAKFVQDLGLKNGASGAVTTQPDARSSAATGGVNNEAAIIAMLTGSLLLSGTDAEEGVKNEAESDLFWICGAVLCAMGAIYSMQLACNGVQCCLKRLRRPVCCLEEDSRSSSATTFSARDEASISTATQRGKGSSSNPLSNQSTTSVNITISSGLQHPDGSTSSPPLQSSDGEDAVAERFEQAAERPLDGVVERPRSISTASGSAAVRAQASRSSSTAAAAERFSMELRWHPDRALRRRALHR